MSRFAKITMESPVKVTYGFPGDMVFEVVGVVKIEEHEDGSLTLTKSDDTFTRAKAGAWLFYDIKNI